jgi:hypothetical protein
MKDANKLNELDEVLLKDGRRATIMGGREGYYFADVGETPETWDNIPISVDDIAEVLS